MSNDKDILRVNNLKTYFFRAHKAPDYRSTQVTIKAVDDISLRIKEGTTLGLAGESGCGKTTVGMSVLNLIPYMEKVEGHMWKHPISKGEILGGEIWYKGKDLLKMTQEEIRHIRGKEISMIFQNPIPSLNPVEIIGFQVGEAVLAHEQTEIAKVRQLVLEHLGKVELRDAKQRYRNDPHMFSGGEGQRIMIAMALINHPSLLIADEPTKSLDVIVQRQVLSLLQEMKKQFNLSMLLITHDLAVIAETSDYVATMYAGKIMEHGDVISMFKHPRHPYTQGLLASIPRLYGKKDIRGLKGEPPNPWIQISGCKFHPRCPYAIEECESTDPPFVEIEPDHSAACIRVNEIPEFEN